MGYNCKILLDSISETGKRLTTFEITFPRIVLAEWNTHRMFSRNSASSRAIPFKKQIERVLNSPFIPERFPIDGKGMQPNAYVERNISYPESLYWYAEHQWLAARDSAVRNAKALYNSLPPNDETETIPNVHKQIVNRLLEPFLWHTCIVTATEFDNFFKLRCDENAQYEIRRIADLMYEAYHAFDNKVDEPTDIITGNKTEWQAIRPQRLKVGEWHCPLIYEKDGELVLKHISDNMSKLKKEFQFTNDGTKALIELTKRISVARCARISYLTHDGKRDIEKDLELFERLRTSGHWSPFEHVATPYFQPKFIHGQPQVEVTHDNLRSGNFIGWKQYRKEFADENCVSFRVDRRLKWVIQ